MKRVDFNRFLTKSDVAQQQQMLYKAKKANYCEEETT